MNLRIFTCRLTCKVNRVLEQEIEAIESFTQFKTLFQNVDIYHEILAEIQVYFPPLCTNCQREFVNKRLNKYLETF